MSALGSGCVKTLCCDRVRQVFGDWPWDDSLRVKTVDSRCYCRSRWTSVTEDNPVRVIEAFIDELDLGALGFEGVQPAATGRPAYHPSTMLRIYLYGYLKRLQSSRRLEREARRDIELMWLNTI